VVVLVFSYTNAPSDAAIITIIGDAAIIANVALPLPPPLILQTQVAMTRQSDMLHATREQTTLQTNKEKTHHLLQQMNYCMKKENLPHEQSSSSQQVIKAGKISM